MGDVAMVGANGAGDAVVAVAEAPRRRFGIPLAVLSGLCLTAAFPSLEIAPLAWVGLVPLLLAIRGRSPGRAFGLGWVAGTVFYLVTCYWIVYTIGHYTALPVPVAALLLLMEQGKAADVATILAELREQVRALDERVAELGRHL